MFKKGIALLLALCIFGSLIPFAAAEEGQIADSALLPETAAETEPAATEYEPAETEAPEEVPEDVAEEEPALRSPSTYSTSYEGKVFIARMAGKDISSSMIAGAEGIVRTFIEKYNLDLSQSQFDALVDFAFDCPGAFTNNTDKPEDKNEFEKLLISGSYTDVSLADAMCGFVLTDATDFYGDHYQELSEAMVKRRVREAKLFCHDDYDGKTDTICYLILYPNGGKSPRSARCYAKGKAYGSLPVATKSGKSFDGWYGSVNTGSHISTSTIACSDLKVFAHWSAASVSNPNIARGGDPERSDTVVSVKLRSSEALLAFIRTQEGFVHKAQADNGQQSIGYGCSTKPGSYPDGIYREEAEMLMREYISGFESNIEGLERKLPAALKQQELDALVSFTYNLGEKWISGNNRLTRWLKKRTDDLELVNAIGVWSNYGSHTHIYRRMDEAEMFLYGDYQSNRGGDRFRAIWFDLNGGTKSAGADQILYYYKGQPYGVFFSELSREGYVLSGWADKNGTSYSPNQIAAGDKFIVLYAQWTQNQTTPDPIPISNNPLDGYKDLDKTAWYAEAIAYMVENKYMSGTSATTFEPAGEMTRAMLVSVLYRISGKSIAYEKTFSDVAKDAWYANAVVWASKNGIVSGVGDNRFDPGGKITREQLAVILYNFTKSCNYDVSKQGDLSSFPDSCKVSAWAKTGVSWAVGMGLLSGQTDENGKTYLAPLHTASRAEVASLLSRFLMATA